MWAKLVLSVRPSRADPSCGVNTLGPGFLWHMSDSQEALVQTWRLIELPVIPSHVETIFGQNKTPGASYVQSTGKHTALCPRVSARRQACRSRTAQDHWRAIRSRMLPGLPDGSVDCLTKSGEQAVAAPAHRRN